MFELSFEYLAKVIQGYFTCLPPNTGERFHLHVEKQEQVAELFSALTKRAELPFLYSEYSSAAMQLQGVKLIIAASHNATESFLTRLRNKSASQENEFKNSASQILTAISGLHVSALPERTVREEAVDFVIEGEGFSTFEELLNELKRGKKRVDPPGRMYSIYMASKLVKDGGYVLVHDCCREIEIAFSDKFLKEKNLLHTNLRKLN